MKLFSAEIMTVDEKRSAKAVLVNKTNNGYTLLSHYITEPENLKALSGDAPVYFSINYYDTIIETLSIPPVSDPKTFKLLAKNKLKDRLEEGVDYLITYKRDEESIPDNTGSVEHKVYLIPEALYDDMDVLSEKQKQKTDIFTLSDFAICGISAKIFPDEVVFHAFADACKIVVAVSRNNVILYTRMMEYEKDESGALESVFYESLNLTYMFVAKNLHIEVEKLVLSGLLTEHSELSKMLFDFNKIPQSVIIPSQIINGCSRSVFHEYMLPISLVMLDDSYDFTPVEYREQRGFNTLKVGFNILQIIAIVVLIMLNMSVMSDLSLSMAKFNAKTNVIDFEVRKYEKLFTGDDHKKYALFYMNEFQKNSKNIFDMYDDIGILLDKGSFSDVRFSSGRKEKVVSITDKINFANLIEADEHRNTMMKILDQISKGKNYKVNDQSRYNMDKLSANIRITMTKAIK